MALDAQAEAAGRGAGPTGAAAPWRVLDEPGEWAQFGRPAADDSGCWESSVVVDGMHCPTCALTIEDCVRAVPGVRSVEVNGANHRARVVWFPGQTRPSAWMAAMAAAGYTPVPANDRLAQGQRQRSGRAMLWRWLVAGLCMMQVMMYAYPAYVAKPGEMAADSLQLLRWASWVLTLPVLLFSCQPFFAGAWRDLRARRIGMDLPVALGVGVMFVVSSAGTFEPDGLFGREVYFDSLTMFVFFLLTGRWLELRLRDRTAGALEALLNRLPDTVSRRSEDGRWVPVTTRQLRTGDVIEVPAGQVFAVDGLVLSGQTRVDESLLSGESRPLVRASGGRVLAGSHNLVATVQVQVEQVGAQTRYGQMVALMDSASSARPGVALLADRLARPFLLAVLLAAAAAAAHGWAQDPGHALMVAAAVLVVTCPCALSLATPTALLAAAGRLARQGVLVRRLDALEHLAQIDQVVFDKTGTLTEDALMLAHVRTREGVTSHQALGMAAALARASLHPAARALSAAVPDVQSRWVALDVHEVAGQGLKGYLLPVDTSFEPGNGFAVRLGSAAFCGLDESVTPGLGGVGPVVCISDGHGWLGSFELQEALRSDARSTLEGLRTQGLGLAMLSGDRAGAVSRVARALGLVQARGGCSPQDKLAFLRDWQTQGRRVLMVGDGLNDGPVLAAAHVSMAFGHAVPLTQARSDMVVLGTRLSAVREAWQTARRTQAVIRQNLAWSLAYNAVCVPLAVLGWLPAWLAGLGMALSSLVVVLNSLRLSRADRPADPPTP